VREFAPFCAPGCFVDLGYPQAQLCHIKAVDLYFFISPSFLAGLKTGAIAPVLLIQLLDPENALFFVRLTVGGWRNCTSHNAGKDDPRHDIGSHQHEFRKDRHSQDLKFKLERSCKTEDKGSRERAEGIPIAESHGSESQKTFACCHAFVEAARRAQVQVGLAKPAIMPSSSGALFFIWPAIRGRRIAPANDSRQHDDRKQVR
jgi:hypothetical protein